MNIAQTQKATYTFNELIDRITICGDYNELQLLASVWRQELCEYSAFHTLLIKEAFRLMSQILIP